MIYMLKVYMLVAVPVFGLAGAAILALTAWRAASEYAEARRRMDRMARGAGRELLVISRSGSRSHETPQLRAA
jgi:hypothetical protein